MKKISLIFILLLICNYHIVLAKENNDITSSVIIKYRWYKEEITDSLYYPASEKLEGYLEDDSKFIYNKYYSDWKEEYCSYSKRDYVVETKNKYIYSLLVDPRYIKLTNINYNLIKTLKIYIKNTPIDYEVVSNNNNEVIIDIGRTYFIGYIWFYIDTDKDYEITIANDIKFNKISLTKKITDEKVLIPDENWISTKSSYTNMHTFINYDFGTFISKKEEIPLCRIQKIMTYRYKIEKVYYDDNYYEYIEGYIPDYNDYVVIYVDKLPQEEVIVTDTKTEYETKYVYIQKENENNSESDNLKENTCKNNEIIKTKYITNDVYKKIYKIPKYIYFIIVFLILLICLICKKKSTK